MLARGGSIGRRASSAIEFALIAPFILTLVIGVVDIAHACIVWEQTCNAARAVAEAAEKLSYSPLSSQTTLTATQMQAAMSSAYPVLPGLPLGSGNASSNFGVTLSSVVFTPTCTSSSGCKAQVPYLSWSTALTQSGGASGAQKRACGKLTAVASFPDDSTQLTKMVSWSQGQIALAPQVVADVRTTFVPLFSTFIGPVTFWSSAAMPAPIGGADQAITLASPDASVTTCTVPG